MNTLRLLKPALTLAARHELAARFEGAEIRAILDEAFDSYDTQRPTLSLEATVGGRTMVHFAALTIGLYRALLSHEVPEAEARSLTAGVTERVYEKLAIFPTALSAIGRGSTRDRVKRATDLFRRFPFTAPAYDMVDVAAADDVVAFDVRRCPVAEHFRAHDLSELCVASWCDLDYPLAERWGARLERSQTIAGGASHCDFRWRIPDVNASGKSESE